MVSLLKVEFEFFQKLGHVPKQTCSPSAVRDVSTHEERRERSENMTDISQAERRQKDRDGG